MRPGVRLPAPGHGGRRGRRTVQRYTRRLEPGFDVPLQASLSAPQRGRLRARLTETAFPTGSSAVSASRTVRAPACGRMRSVIETAFVFAVPNLRVSSTPPADARRVYE